MPAITAILNVHREGMLAYPSLMSVVRAKSYAAQRGCEVEILVVLDRADQNTLALFQAHEHRVDRLVPVAHGDLGLARNSGVEAARGEWVAFLDGDDLWTEDWLTGALQVALNEPRPTIWHPEFNLYFGEYQYIFQHIDMDDERFDLISLSLGNYWTALAFAKRATFLENPYAAVRLDRKLGFEDWHWNAETIARGLRHKCVPGGVHLIRSRPDSLLRRTVEAGALMTPSTLFRSMLERRAEAKPQ